MLESSQLALSSSCRSPAEATKGHSPKLSRTPGTHPSKRNSARYRRGFNDKRKNEGRRRVRQLRRKTRREEERKTFERRAPLASSARRLSSEQANTPPSSLVFGEDQGYRERERERERERKRQGVNPSQAITDRAKIAASLVRGETREKASLLPGGSFQRRHAGVRSLERERDR